MYYEKDNLFKKHYRNLHTYFFLLLQKEISQPKSELSTTCNGRYAAQATGVSAITKIK